MYVTNFCDDLGETNFLLHGSHLSQCNVIVARGNSLKCERCRASVGHALREVAKPNSPSGDAAGDVIALKFYTDTVAFKSRSKPLDSTVNSISSVLW